MRDSRAALDTLRAEHTARLAAQAEAAERQRQMQMAAKLQAMRKKKHEYLQYQRQLALQRVQVLINRISTIYKKSHCIYPYIHYFSELVD